MKFVDRFVGALCLLLVPAAAIAQAALALTLDDGHHYVRYGQTLQYVITLTNSGDADATDVPVSIALSPAWDPASATWTCYPGTSGVSCTANGSGLLNDTATVPIGAVATWVVSVTTFAVAPDVAGVDVSAQGAAPRSDIDTLVIFRDGFNVPYGDGTR